MEYINGRIQEKNKDYKKNCYYNEFFTPYELIEKMLSHIPDHLWNTETTWFEPTCGEGFFMIVIFDRLFHHPSHQHLQEEERIKHISNNLYLNDIQPENIQKVRELLPYTHITNKDFLTWDVETKYDVIIGNPPFQTPSTNYLNGIRKSSKIYEKITEKCLFLLREGGHLCFITPTNLWGGKGLKSGVYETIVRDYWTKYIFLNNLKKRWFPNVGQNLKMCFFVVSKEPPGSTMIETENDIISVKLKETMNPVEDWTLKNTELLNTFLTSRTKYFHRTSEKATIKGDSYVSKIDLSREFLESRLCILQNLNRVFFVDSVPDETVKSSMIGVEKYILFRMKPFSRGIYDKDGKFYLSSQVYFIPLTQFTKEEKERIISFFESETYQTIMRLTTTSQFIKGSIIECLNIDYICSLKPITKRYK